MTELVFGLALSVVLGLGINLLKHAISSRLDKREFTLRSPRSGERITLEIGRTMTNEEIETLRARIEVLENSSGDH